MIDFECETVGLRRIDAASEIGIGAGSSALGKLVTVRGGWLRASAVENAAYVEQRLPALPAEVRHRGKVIWGGTEPLL